MVGRQDGPSLVASALWRPDRHRPRTAYSPALPHVCTPWLPEDGEAPPPPSPLPRCRSRTTTSLTSCRCPTSTWPRSTSRPTRSSHPSSSLTARLRPSSASEACRLLRRSGTSRSASATTGHMASRSRPSRAHRLLQQQQQLDLRLLQPSVSSSRRPTASLPHSSSSSSSSSRSRSPKPQRPVVPLPLPTPPPRPTLARRPRRAARAVNPRPLSRPTDPSAASPSGRSAHQRSLPLEQARSAHP